MALRTRKRKQCSNGLRDEPIEQPLIGTRYEPIQQSVVEEQQMGTIHEPVQQAQIDQHQVRTMRESIQHSPIEQHSVGTRHDLFQQPPSVLRDEFMEPPSDGSDFLQKSDNAGNGYESTNFQKRARGPTYMKEIWGRPKHLSLIEVKIDENGLPVNEKTQFSEFLGSLARNSMYCPIDVEDWLKVPTMLKMDMLKVIKGKFNLPPGLEAWTLRSIGKKWRSWKSELKAKYYDPSIPIHEVKFHRDVRVEEEQWIKIWAYWGSDDAKKVSERNKKARLEKNMNHTTGKKSFAELRNKMTKELGRPPSRVEMFDRFYSRTNGTPSSSVVAQNLSKMKEMSTQLPSNSQDIVGPNDIFSQVVGPEKHGRVRMFGEGVNPTDLWGDIPSRNVCHRITIEQRSTLSRLESRLQEQDEKIASLTKMVSMQHGHISPDSPNHPSSSSNNVSIQIPTNRAIRVGSMVSLKSLFDPTKVVAKGFVRSVNPSDEVGGQVLGPNWYEIHVQVLVDPKEQLIRPYDLHQTIQDALGAPVAWPCHLVTLNEY